MAESSPKRSPKRARTAKAMASDKDAERTVEQIYQKKTQLEHILLRPDSYVGSIERQSQDHYVWDSSIRRMIRRRLEYVPALFKIFDEILVNAADNLVRCPEQDLIQVCINSDEGWVSVLNTGRGLPVQMHREHNCYVPELVFGHLLTSDNYDDAERKVTGGRNGYGAKLTNIFSKQFIVETADSVNAKTYKQVWKGNMGTCNPPRIRPHTGSDFTQVTFYPDFARFGMAAFEDDIVALMSRRAYDVAAATHGRCKVTLNGEVIAVHSFEDYVKLHLEPDAFMTSAVVNDRWEVAVALTDGSGFQQVSFVNSICTSRGGTHVNMVVDQVVNAVMQQITRQKSAERALAVKPTHVRSRLWVFVNCLIENPAFDSQTKETLTTKKERFGSTCPLPEQVVSDVLESGLVDALQEWSKAFAKSELAQHLNKSESSLQKRLFGIPKLEDANKAGTKESSQCTLVLTEGDSAKALVVAGMSVIGRDYYGVFPLRGKLRNVRELTVKQMVENKEIEQIMRILALDASKDYQDSKGLRYGSIMIMTDQDYDGSHIKGLIINLIQHHFPSLLRIPGFLKEFVTPIVKVSKGDEQHTFFTLQDYQAWREGHNERGWTSKYYKGLGTSTSKEAKEYFSALDSHQIEFRYEGEEDDALIDMAFNRERADDRKEWISGWEEGDIVDHSQPSLSYSDFVNKELVQFAKYDVERMIPSVVDGFKPSQRKVLFACFKRKLNADMKVAQLSGYVAEHSMYHHGEVSLQSTIIGLAQTFVGSNNLNLLVPSGQFGTRLAGGKDHAASRYIYTRLAKVTRCLFPEQDDPVLEYLQEEGASIEPKWYCPVIPLALVNGAEGIGVGWSTSVPNFNPREIIANVRRWLQNEELTPMAPWYRGFTGSIVQAPGSASKYEVWGRVTKRSNTRVEITELPVKKWTQDYKEYLIDLLPQREGSEKRSLVTDIREHHTENTVHFVLAATPDKLAEAERKGLERAFHLRTTLSTTNMMLFDADGKLRKYESAEDVIKDFAKVRLEVYQQRKDFQVEKLEREMQVLSNKYKFVYLVVTGVIEVENRKSAVLCKQLRKEGLSTMAALQGKPPPERGSPEETGPAGFKYLLSMKMWTLTEDRLAELKRQLAEKEAQLEALKKLTLQEMWESDLVRLEEAMDATEREEAKEAEAAKKLASKRLEEDDTGLVNRRCVLVLSKDFRIKRLRTTAWRATKGKATMKTRSRKRPQPGAEVPEEEKEDEKEEEEAEVPDDGLQGIFCCYEFDALLVFSEDGTAYKLQALDVPLAKTVSSPAALTKDFLPELGDRRVAAMVSVPQTQLRNQVDEFVVLISEQGYVKKVMLDRFRGLRPGLGVTAMSLGDGDALRWAHRGDKDSALILVSCLGRCHRTSLGPTFRGSTLKGAGRVLLRIKQETGDKLASTCISGTDPSEALPVRTASRAVAPAAAGEAADGAEQPKKAKPGQLGVDDDSDNAPDEAEAEAEAENESDEEDEEDGDAAAAAADSLGRAAVTETQQTTGGADNDDEDNEDAMVLDDPYTILAEPAAPGPAAGPGDVRGPKQALFLITQSGMGQRYQIEPKRLKLQRAGGAGRFVLKVATGDQIIGACVVAVTTAARPKEGRKPWQIYLAEHKDELKEHVPVPEEGEGGEREKGSNLVWHSLLKAEASRRFSELAEEEQAKYIALAQEEHAAFAKALELYQQQQQDEVMVASKSGATSRVNLSRLPLAARPGKGKQLVKLVGSDVLCSMSLMTAVEEGEEQVSSKVAKDPTAAAASKPLQPRKKAAPGPKIAAACEAKQEKIGTDTSVASAAKRASSLPAEARVATPQRQVSADARRLRQKCSPPWASKSARISKVARSLSGRSLGTGKDDEPEEVADELMPQANIMEVESQSASSSRAPATQSQSSSGKKAPSSVEKASSGSAKAPFRVGKPSPPNGGNALKRANSRRVLSEVLKPSFRLINKTPVNPATMPRTLNPAEWKPPP
mmetsp:Transcript_21054/g.48751  ORF Transcript_21054/g.48751 Transcript_21054/m.48751 type:complete len:1973 (+) Transcript_21054:72-5990(+)